MIYTLTSNGPQQFLICLYIMKWFVNGVYKRVFQFKRVNIRTYVY